MINSVPLNLLALLVFGYTLQIVLESKSGRELGLSYLVLLAALASVVTEGLSWVLTVLVQVVGIKLIIAILVLSPIALGILAHKKQFKEN